YTSLGKRLQYLSIRTCEFMTGDQEREDLRMLYVQHKAVLNAIKMGFPELAREAMSSHIDFCAENCIKNRYLLEKQSDK
ncbi:MAG: FCD domain-containing protein, partial [Anaerovoracaceae bacterium]|nr:FCD domain-containing protein [Anaerovoracaceae bacterium]